MIEKINLDKTNAWPFVEAKKILRERKKAIEQKGKIVLQTGYGPSGLPHIGTFGEVARTSMVVNALDHLIDLPKEIITFSDDMDGLRKVPDNVPNKSMLEKHLGKSLTSIPDPFEKFKSFGEHNNSMLKKFLDDFGFSYEFLSSTDLYKSGFFNDMIKTILKNQSNILSIVLPTLREERKKTYSPFLPVCPNTGKVLQVKIEEYNLKNNTVIYKDPNNTKLQEISVLDGNCKLQWKVDWAMRWMALEVDYEMCGKDLTDSVDLGKKICNSLGKSFPINLIYEMFLDENGEKISKSRGNGIGIEEWLRYSSPESLSLFMFQKPKSAKKLHFDVIPKNVDDYKKFLEQYNKNNSLSKCDNPVWHIHSGNPPKIKDYSFNFNTLLNLVSICNSTDSDVIWDFIKEYDKNINQKNDPYINELVKYAINYYKDISLPKKKYKLIDENSMEIFYDLKNTLINLNKSSKSEEIQSQLYEIGKRNKFENLRDFFKLIYQVLLGQDEGPRLGSFISFYGIGKTISLIDRAIKNEDLSK